MSRAPPDLSNQEMDALIAPVLDELVRLNKFIVGYDPESKEGKELFNAYQKKFDDILNTLQEQRVKERYVHQQIFKRETQNVQRVEEQQERQQANTFIITAQSQTINLIKPILVQYSKNWKTRLGDPINIFWLLKDGLILFSKSWLKNETFILSTPILFRPVYNIILCPVLKFINHFYSLHSTETHPGAAFYIAGDQGIGKTSLMLILMSTLSDHSLKFSYGKGTKAGQIQNFKLKDKRGGVLSFVDSRDIDEDTSPEPPDSGDVSIHIYDDYPPPSLIVENHLYIIFTSPDQNRLPLPKKKQLPPPKKEQQPPADEEQNSSPTLDRIFSPEEEEPSTTAKEEPSTAYEELPPTTEHSSDQLHHIFRLPTFSLAEDAVAMVGCTPTVPLTLLSPEDMQLRTAEQHLLLSIEIEKEEIAHELPQSSVDLPSSSKNATATTQLKALLEKGSVSFTRWHSFLKSFRKQYAEKTEGEEKSEQTSNRKAADIEFYKSLDAQISGFQNDHSKEIRIKAIIKVVDWLLDQLKLPSGRNKEQAAFIKTLIHKLVDHELKGENPKSVLNHALTYTLPPPDIQSDVHGLSDKIKQSNEANIDDDSLEMLKTHFQETEIRDVENRRNVRNEVERISGLHEKDDVEKRNILFQFLIDMMVTPPPYDSQELALKSLFVLPEKPFVTETILRNILSRLLTNPSGNLKPKEQLDIIVDELVKYLLFSQTQTNPPSSATTHFQFNERRMALIVCDLLSTIVEPKHDSVEKRLGSVIREIRAVRNRLSFVTMMDVFSFIAGDMNILVTPHSILKGLSERAESSPDLNLHDERDRVYFRNLRDRGLSKWVTKGTETLLRQMDNKEGVMKITSPEESVLQDVQDSIMKNLDAVIGKFITKYREDTNIVNESKWLAIIRSMMNTILFLIDAGIPRKSFLKKCKELRELLTAVISKHEFHLLKVADYPQNQCIRDPTDPEGADENPDDYVNDVKVFSDHFGAQQSLESLRLPRTLQIGTITQERLERMSTALFARNLLWFLEIMDDLPIDDACYENQFFTNFLQGMNPGDVVHRSFVDFMNTTGLLSQRNFGLKWEDFTRILKKRRSTMESVTRSLQKTCQSPSPAPTKTRLIPHDKEDSLEPFSRFVNRQFGVFLLLWASTELLRKAAGAPESQEFGDGQTPTCLKETRPSQESEDEKRVNSLNVARISIFGPSPRWLTSTDVRTNRGVIFLWEGVLRSKNTKALTDVAESNHSRMMGFNTEQIFFENTLDAAWNDITALVPVLSASTKKDKRPKHTGAVFSLVVRKTAVSIKRMESQVTFVAVSPFVEQIMQSEVVSAIARLMNQEDYTKFRNAQKAKHIDNLPENVEEPLICISFLLNCPTPIYYGDASTSFHDTQVHQEKDGELTNTTPFLKTSSTMVTSMPMLTFPELSNRSVEGTNFPKSLIKTERGKTDFYAEDLQNVKGEKEWPGIDALIVSRGNDKTSETIFMPIQGTVSFTHSLKPEGIVLIQQLLFQAMCHLEPSEGIVALYNYATTKENPTFPSLTGILGFHMVSSHLQFEPNTINHLSSILRHRDHPLVTIPVESQPTMSTHDITEKLLASVRPYPSLSQSSGPWKTSIPEVNHPIDTNFTLPYRWRPFYGVLCQSSTYKLAQDQMVRRTIRELNRVGITADNLGVSDDGRKEAFLSFLLSTTISCRRNELLHPTKQTTTKANDTQFIRLVKSIVGKPESSTLKSVHVTHNATTPASNNSIRDERLRSLDKLCTYPCIEARMHNVHRIMSNHAMKRIIPPAQEYLSVLQSKKDGGVFRVPARNNLSAILHCGTVLLDHVFPLPSPTVTPNQAETSPRSRTLRIPLHSFVLAKYGFSNSIPPLCELNHNQVIQEVTDVTPAPLMRWHPRRVVIDPSLLPQCEGTDSLELFTNFIHRLFDNTFIPVTTSFSPTHLDCNRFNTFIFSQFQKIKSTLTSHYTLTLSSLKNLEEQNTPNDPTTKHTQTPRDKKSQLQHIITTLRTIKCPKKVSAIFPLLPKIRSSLSQHPLPCEQSESVFTVIESIEAIQNQPTLVFVKSGSDFFTSTNTSSMDVISTATQSPSSTTNLSSTDSSSTTDTLSEIIIDTTTKSQPFPIPFSTGYKTMKLKEEMKDVFEPLTHLLPDRFMKEVEEEEYEEEERRRKEEEERRRKEEEERRRKEEEERRRKEEEERRRKEAAERRRKEEEERRRKEEEERRRKEEEGEEETGEKEGDKETGEEEEETGEEEGEEEEETGEEEGEEEEETGEEEGEEEEETGEEEGEEEEETGEEEEETGEEKGEEEGEEEETGKEEKGEEERSETSSKDDSTDRTRAILDSAIQRMGKTPMTSLFMFVVDETLPDHESLPMSLLSADGSVDCGMMRQRSLADVLWILFLTRITREVMALPLNTSIGPNSFTNYIIPFLANTLQIKQTTSTSSPTETTAHITKVLNALIDRATATHLNATNRISSIGLELLVSVFPKLKDETHVLLLSHLLMVCPSHQNGESRLDDLVNHPSPKIGLFALIRWFELLIWIADQNAKKIKVTKNKSGSMPAKDEPKDFIVAINKGRYTPAKVGANLVHAFYLIIERAIPDDSLIRLFHAIRRLEALALQPLIFTTDHQQTLQELRLLADERREAHEWGTTHNHILTTLIVWIDKILTTFNHGSTETDSQG
ncbi:hypothetical protein BLNAU_5728 [Blattamonas nauphoetae]|uniref:Uncharacterized protein n=1 Tax=Blattamonas nauphoetae TaxID=2049346 RepID=A0ABQ9Y6T7_9EUKA|nr:hypothetical protein BLNAU_5728 [Blattamonas nauphoetae]